MIRSWEKSKVDIYFDDVEGEQLIRQGFNNLVNEVGEAQISDFVEAIDSLHELPAVHALVTDSYRYTI